MRRIPDSAALFLALAALSAGALSRTVCPDFPKARRHFDLAVRNTDIALPGGKTLAGLTFNGSYVGPAIVVQLGEEVSIDVTNEASVGGWRTRWSNYR